VKLKGFAVILGIAEKEKESSQGLTGVLRIQKKKVPCQEQ
jgi:hypothetical protein